MENTFGLRRGSGTFLGGTTGLGFLVVLGAVISVVLHTGLVALPESDTGTDQTGGTLGFPWCVVTVLAGYPGVIAGHTVAKIIKIF